MKRIDQLAARLTVLATKVEAEQNRPQFTLHLNDGSTIQLIASLSEALTKLTDLHSEGLTVASIEKPAQLDSLMERFYRWFGSIVSGGEPLSRAREAFLFRDDPCPSPPQMGEEEAPERAPHLIR